MGIIRACRHPFLCSAALCAAVCSASADAFAADLILQKVPALTVEQAPQYPQNLARVELGARLETTPASTQANALLASDPVAGFPLENGNIALLLSLPKIENVESLGFYNSGAQGNVTVFVSSAKLPADSPQWKKIGQQDLSDGSFLSKLGPSEAKYVRLVFNATQPGRISSLGVYSPSALSDFTMPRPRRPLTNDGVASVAYNVTDLHAKSRALYVSSGADLKAANNMIDDQPATSYDFSADDAAPTVIIDLGRPLPLRRVTAIFSPRPGKVNFYLLNALPSLGHDAHAPEASPAPNGAVIEGTPAADAPQVLRIDDSALAALKNVAAADDNGSGRVAVDFPEATGRYLMVQWSPSVAVGKFAVFEVAAFGGPNAGLLIASNNHVWRNGRGTSDFKNVRSRDGKDFSKDMSKDLSKESPAEGPAEAQPPGEGPPPGLPQPPPFVFIPQIIPTSP